MNYIDALLSTTPKKTVYIYKEEDRPNQHRYVRTLLADAHATPNDVEYEIYHEDNYTHNIIFDSAEKTVYIKNATSACRVFKLNDKEFADLEKKITHYKHYIAM